MTMVEIAPTARSKCRICTAKIEKHEWRAMICRNVYKPGAYIHVKCMNPDTVQGTAAKAIVALEAAIEKATCSELSTETVSAALSRMSQQ